MIVSLALAAAGCAASVDGSPGDGDSTVTQQESELAISREPVPDDTRVKAVGGGYAERAIRMQDTCTIFGGPCTCYLDGIRTPCSLVAACLHSGNCVVVKYAN